MRRSPSTPKEATEFMGLTRPIGTCDMYKEGTFLSILISGNQVSRVVFDEATEDKKGPPG